jgi:hypothetical protein
MEKEKMTVTQTVPTRITKQLLAARYGQTERFWSDKIPKLADAGVINRVGKFYFGRLETLDEWVGGPEGGVFEEEGAISDG